MKSYLCQNEHPVLLSDVLLNWRLVAVAATLPMGVLDLPSKMYRLPESAFTKYSTEDSSVLKNWSSWLTSMVCVGATLRVIGHSGPLTKFSPRCTLGSANLIDHGAVILVP